MGAGRAGAPLCSRSFQDPEIPEAMRTWKVSKLRGLHCLENAAALNTETLNPY